MIRLKQKSVPSLSFTTFWKGLSVHNADDELLGALAVAHDAPAADAAATPRISGRISDVRILKKEPDVQVPQLNYFSDICGVNLPGTSGTPGMFRILLPYCEMTLAQQCVPGSDSTRTTHSDYGWSSVRTCDHGLMASQVPVSYISPGLVFVLVVFSSVPGDPGTWGEPMAPGQGPTGPTGHPQTKVSNALLCSMTCLSLGFTVTLGEFGGPQARKPHIKLFCT